MQLTHQSRPKKLHRAGPMGLAYDGGAITRSVGIIGLLRTTSICAGKKKRFRTGEGKNCPSRYAPAEQLDEVVRRDLCEVLTHPESITDALRRAHGGQWLPQELKARQENLREGRAALERQLERLTQAYLGEIIPLAEYRRRRWDLEQKDEALEGQQRQLGAQAERRMELAGVADSIEDFCARVQGGLEGATFERRRQLVELLIDRVIVTDEEVEIRYVIPTDPSGEHTRLCHLRTDYSAHPQAVQEHTELPGHGHRRSLLCVLTSPRGYLLSVAPQVRIGGEGSQAA